MRSSAFFAIPLLFVGCADAFSAHPQVAAKVGDQELTVRRLAELMVLGQPLPLTEEVGEELARHWVDVAAFAQRISSGDSLWESDFVREAMWLNLQQLSISRFRDAVVHTDFSITPSAVDSAYRVGEHRIVAHVLKSTPAGASVDYRRAQQADANSIYDRLRNGGSWEDANLQSDDSIAINNNGNLGVLRRGVAVPRFENAAYGLEPGEISPPVETQFGYHIIFRPALDDVRPQFTAFVERELRMRLDSAYDGQLMTELNVRTNPGTPVKLREIASNPFGTHDANDAVASYDGGAVSSERFAEYLRLLAPETHREMATGDAPQLAEFAVGVTLQEILARKVDSAGLQISDSAMVALNDSYHQELTALWEQLGLTPDSLAATGGTAADNTTRLVNRYLDAAVSRQKPITPIPPFLTAQILEGVEWEINPRALTASVQMAQRLQFSAADSLPTTTP